MLHNSATRPSYLLTGLLTHLREQLAEALAELIKRHHAIAVVVYLAHQPRRHRQRPVQQIHLGRGC
jgi:hypothetical protein